MYISELINVWGSC